MTHRIYVSRPRRGLGFPAAAGLIKRAAVATLDAEGIDCPCELSVLLADEPRIRDLNREHRSIDAATDVLSFPLSELTAGHFDPAACEREPDSGLVLLGDMVICLPRCAAQAEEYGHEFARELQYLTVHSVLHLLGYDHLDEAEGKRAMRAREKAVMSKLAAAHTKEEIK